MPPSDSAETLDRERGSSEGGHGARRWLFPLSNAAGLGRDLLGGKGAQLAEMTALGLPVPPGFVISTQACLDYYRSDNRLPIGLMDQVCEAVRRLEAETGRRFGGQTDPLLVSVRSGAPVSMPGMMETVLNLGIDSPASDALAERYSERFALDLHRRFIQMFGGVVLDIDSDLFDRALEEEQHRAGVTRSADLSPDHLRRMIETFKGIVADTGGPGIPSDPYSQLELTIGAVFQSWNGRRAIAYRDHRGIPHDLGTAVNVMSMVFGNLDDGSCTGVFFTRDPSTGAKELYGEYLVNAQGEDVVSGSTTPGKIGELADRMPGIHRQLVGVADKLERHYRDVQDVEFTVEQGRLYILQTRTGQRSAGAAVKLAVDMVGEGLIGEDQAVLRVEAGQIDTLLLPRLDEQSKEHAVEQGMLLTTGLSASPGGATGKVVFSADRAAELGGQGVDVILVRPATSAEDVHGMLAAAGILTSRGGVTSHAAVVARGVGKPCVTGADAVEVSLGDRLFRCGGATIAEGEEISIDGSTGEVFSGSLDMVRPSASGEEHLATLLGWADGFRRLGVWANADYPRDARTAVEFGAEGIGLCRTEHMFFEPERLALVRRMILAAHATGQRPDDETARSEYGRCLSELEEIQTGDFEGIFRAMSGRPVVVRLLDPPLHEFLPSYDDLLADVIGGRFGAAGSEALAEKESLLAAVDDMRETNPMLGLRGCRLGLMYPDIYAMQARAVARAASALAAEGDGADVEIMVPLVSHENEMRGLRELLERTIDDYRQRADVAVDFKIGAMIETPRAALTADRIVESAEFLSFGTNDLTQATFAISRDDAEGKFLTHYVEEGILPQDPFKVVDADGVGRLVGICCELAKQARPDVSVGVCGEHGGDPDSIELFHALGLDYVSCSPYRVPTARLAAAQAALRSRTE